MSTLKVRPIRVPKSLGTGFVAGILVSQAQKETPRRRQPSRRWICDKSQWNKEKSQMEHSTDSILTQAPRAVGVAYLPTAGLAPVKNQVRRGRLPEGVVALRAKPAAAVVVAGEESIDPLDATYRMLDMIQCTLDMTRRRLAEYEKAQRRTG